MQPEQVEAYSGAKQRHAILRRRLGNIRMRPDRHIVENIKELLDPGDQCGIETALSGEIPGRRLEYALAPFGLQRSIHAQRFQFAIPGQPSIAMAMSDPAMIGTPAFAPHSRYPSHVPRTEATVFSRWVHAVRRTIRKVFGRDQTAARPAGQLEVYQCPDLRLHGLPHADGHRIRP
ncbi:hypothetical protein [Mesorhizobium sp. IMUNJ 23232]|uniref:hypothetical protein n=1 Tax=Mesorhizobium sp. IMUNJ 23232 TaxID=3376064 RepID=UPI00379EC266